jgi:hypothetical protein
LPPPPPPPPQSMKRSCAPTDEPSKHLHADTTGFQSILRTGVPLGIRDPQYKKLPNHRVFWLCASRGILNSRKERFGSWTFFNLTWVAGDMYCLGSLGKVTLNRWTFTNFLQEEYIPCPYRLYKYTVRSCDDAVVHSELLRFGCCYPCKGPERVGVPPSQTETETGPVSETLFATFFKYRTTDNVHKPRNI